MDKRTDNNLDAFFALIRSGLWENRVELVPSSIDWKLVYRLAEEQSVVGLVTAGIEHLENVKLPKDVALKFMGVTVQWVRKNLAMNEFIKVLMRKMQSERIISLLVKGQGVAQCYHRPNWRASGDIDLFFDEPNYEKAKRVIPGMAAKVKIENPYTKHIGMKIGAWEVELHGNMRANILRRMDDMIDAVQRDTFDNGGVRVWKNGDTEVLLPSPDNDVIFVFTHILHHFYRGGIGLRQICDWCRLLFSYRQEIDKDLLLKRLKEACILPEWKSFGHFAVEYLGMPEDAMPFYVNPTAKDRRRSRKILEFVLETGNFGHNRDRSFYTRYPYLIRKAISLWRNGGDILHHISLFPDNSCRYFFRFLTKGLAAAACGE